MKTKSNFSLVRRIVKLELPNPNKWRKNLISADENNNHFLINVEDWVIGIV